MKCWIWHDWAKWSKITVVDMVDSNAKAIVQERYCKRCGRYQRQARFDGGS
ncbi:hypothetical protein LCGC14_0208240 [marine sediment metagenome]|uniref:Uncharacterized protein n=1 Tax=marine sediment metagenome TaxID=412755 RepID=A0A0F9XJV8_9ZZZZ